jgi:CMP-N-acetylneuraminic acid synthetase
MIVAVIPAKGSSSRLPNKNMAPVNGRPMIEFAIDEARASKRLDRFCVSTDSDAIAAHAEKLGVTVIRRPEELSGETPIIEVYRHAVAQIEDEGARVVTLIGLQPDHPDRDVSIDEALSAFEDASADRLMSTEADGTKNGAHYILSRRFVETGESRKDVTIIDDCTNIHFQEDLDRAAARLAARTGGG